MKNNEDIRFDILFYEANVGMAILDKDLKFLQANHSFCNFIGYTEEELKKLTPLDITIPEEEEKTKEMLANLQNNRHPNKKIEKKYITKEGKTVWGEVINKQVKNKDKECLYYATIVDVTDRKNKELEITKYKTELEHQQRILMKSHEISKTGFWQWDIKTNKVEWNSMLHQIYETEKGFKPSFEAYLLCIDENRRGNAKRTILKALEDKSYFENSYKVTTFKNNVKYLKTWGYVELAPNGEPLKMLGICMDVTSHVHKEEELSRANKKLNIVLSGTNTGLWEWDLITNKVHYNREWGEQLGYSHDELNQDFNTWEKLVHPEDINEAKKRIKAYLSGEIQDYDYVHRLKHKDGSWKHILTKGVISEISAEGKPLYFLGTHTDVNKEEQYLQEINEYEKHFSISTELTCVADESGFFLNVNKRFTEVLGFSKEEFLSQPYTTFIHEDDVEETIANVEKIIKTKTPEVIYNRYKCKNGGYRSLMWSTTQDKKTGLWYSSARDVTDLIEEKEKNEQYLDLLDNSLNEVYVVDVQTLKYIYVNKGGQNNIGYTLDEFKELSPMDIKVDLTPEDIQGVITPLINKEKEFVHVETRHLRKDGSTYMAFINLQLTKLGGKEVFVGFATNISQRIKQEKELEKVKNDLSNIIDYANVGIAYASSDAKVISLNSRFAEILEYEDKNELVGKTVADFTYFEDLKKDSDLIDEIKAGKRERFQLEKRYVTKNNTIKWGDLNVSVVRNAKGEVENLIAMVVDITERKEKEEIIQVLTHLSATHGGERYFSELAVLLSTLLGVKFAIIGIYDKEREMVDTIGFADEGVMQENFSYTLENTPCRVALDENIEIIEQDVQKAYPKDEYLVNMNASSYVGVTMFNENKEPVGIIALLDDKPLLNTDFITSILTQISTRTETEIIRTKVEKLIIEREARYRGMVENSLEITCLIDEKGVIKYITPSIYKVLQYKVDEVIGKSIYSFMEKSSIEMVKEKFKLQFLTSKKEEYDIYRFQSKDGEIKHFRAILTNHINTKGINAFIINAQDVTSMLEAESEMYNIILQTEEKERQRLSQDLHDGLGQTIAAANMYMNTLDGLIKEQVDEETYDIFKVGKTLVDKSTKETRMVSHNVMPPSLLQFGLNDSLSEMITNYQKIKTDFKMSFTSNLKEQRFEYEVELSLYRIIQELVNNAIKHSKAQAIDVSINKEDSLCKIIVKDDGVGFDENEIRNKKQGIGLRSIEQRISLIGGNLSIKKMEKGMEFLIQLKV